MRTCLSYVIRTITIVIVMVVTMHLTGSPILALLAGIASALAYVMKTLGE